MKSGLEDSSIVSVEVPVVSNGPYSTGDVAKICRVCPATAVKWIDKGILKGRRLPDSLDRRVEHSDLVNFMEKYKMPKEYFPGYVSSE